MTETLTGKQVLALLAQDEVPEIEQKCYDGGWYPLIATQWSVAGLLNTKEAFRVKPKPPRRLSVTIASGEVVSWPEPVREALKPDTEFFYVSYLGEVESGWHDGSDHEFVPLAFGNVHLTREAAQEHADALRRINTQEVGKC